MKKKNKVCCKNCKYLEPADEDDIMELDVDPFPTCRRYPSQKQVFIYDEEVDWCGEFTRGKMV